MIKTNFDSGWEFTDQSGMFAAMMAQWQPVNLPHDASISRPRNASYPTGSGGGYAWSGVVTYRKKFSAPEDWKGKRVQLELEGVYMNAEVTLNGNVVALHPYGYTSFVVDLTPYLIFEGENTLTVVANNSAQPNSRWYSGTGIYRHVWLRVGGKVVIPPWGVFVTTPVADPAASTVQVATELTSYSTLAERVTLRSSVLDAQGRVMGQVESPVVLEASQTVKVDQSLLVRQVTLWSLEQPALYTLVSEVLADGQVLDVERTPFGIRSIAVDAEQGFRLNGVPLKLKGGCVHHDHGLLGAASYDRAEERKIELMKAAGFNAVRSAHNPPAPAFLDACDRLGMLVIDETFDCWRMGKNPNDYHLYFEDWWQRDTESMVKRDRNHPSVIMWSIGNEVGERTGASDGYTWAKKQADFVRSLDPTRPVTSAVPALFEDFIPLMAQGGVNNIFELLESGSADQQEDRWGRVTRPFNEILDVVGYNYLVRRYESDGQKFPGRVICGTETFPHRAFAFWDATLRLPYVIGDFVWTAVDYLGEAGIGRVSFDEDAGFAAPYPYHLANCGDIDICGFKRPQSYFRDLLWGVRQAPFLAVLDPRHFGKKITFSPWGWEPVIDSWSFPGSEGKPTLVYVYSVDDEVELLVNGVSVGRKPAGAASENKVAFEVTYQPGVLEVIGYRHGQEAGRTSLKTTGDPFALRATPDRAALRAEYGDLAYVTVEIVDREGAVVRYADTLVSLEVEGAGELIAVGSANPVSEEPYVGNQRKAYQGRLMVVVRTTGQAGEIVLKASAEGLKDTTLRLQAE
ncbi:MAG TPA: beta-galactosidase [Anaerolinea thermolimosa]|uniref:Beta-galactosidase n=1 Tax=Anaerolinea thermolimosa TaxID=229919 RepID=A0A3D1JF10_9CHLR|nr:beta-galactosidase [Anaerolinea thermolimosa]